MKIVAEFNSVEELLNFTNTFGAKTFIPMMEEKVVVEAPKKEVAVTEEQTKEVKKESNQVQENKAPAEESQITFDMVKDICNKALKAKKSSDVKAIVAKYGAKKMSDLKEDYYQAVYEEVGGLL